MIVGQSFHPHPAINLKIPISSDYWAVKIDANGNKVWDKTLGGRVVLISNCNQFSWIFDRRLLQALQFRAIDRKIPKVDLTTGLVMPRFGIKLWIFRTGIRQ